MTPLLLTMLGHASMIGVWQAPSGSHIIIPFFHPEKVPVLLVSSTGNQQVKEGVWLKTHQTLHIKTEGYRQLNYDLEKGTLTFSVDKDVIPLTRHSTVIENHITAGVWKDAHQEIIIPVFSKHQQWVVRYFSHEPPRLYEATWQDIDGGMITFPSTPPCTLSFDAGQTEKGQIICGDTAMGIERHFRPGPSSIEVPSGSWQNEDHLLNIQVQNDVFVSSTIQPTPKETASISSPPEEDSPPPEPETPVLIELQGNWVQRGQIFNLIGQTQSYTCTYHALSPNRLRCNDGTADSYWSRVE